MRQCALLCDLRSEKQNSISFYTPMWGLNPAYLCVFLFFLTVCGLLSQTGLITDSGAAAAIILMVCHDLSGWLTWALYCHLLMGSVFPSPPFLYLPFLSYYCNYYYNLWFLAPRLSSFKPSGSKQVYQISKWSPNKTMFSLRSSGTSLIEFPLKDPRSLNIIRGSILVCKMC